jgi:hypothetical protein
VVCDLDKMHTFIHSTSMSIRDALDTSTAWYAEKFAQGAKENEAVHARSMQRHGTLLRAANKRVGDFLGTSKDLRSFIEREKAKMVTSFSLAERCVALLNKRFQKSKADLDREREEASGINDDVSTPRQVKTSAVHQNGNVFWQTQRTMHLLGGGAPLTTSLMRHCCNVVQAAHLRTPRQALCLDIGKSCTLLFIAVPFALLPECLAGCGGRKSSLQRGAAIIWVAMGHARDSGSLRHMVYLPRAHTRPLPSAASIQGQRLPEAAAQDPQQAWAG